jgi:hypothetical protein
MAFWLLGNVIVAVISPTMFGDRDRDMMAENLVFVTPEAFFGFIAENSSAHGITFWAILLYCSPLVLLMAAVSVMLAAPAKRRLIPRQLSTTEFIRWKDLIPSMILEAFAVTGSLIFTVYALEEWLEAGSTYHGDGWMIVFLVGTALLNSLIMIVPHMRLLTEESCEHRPRTPLMKSIALAYRLGLVSPGAFAVVITGLLVALSK